MISVKTKKAKIISKLNKKQVWSNTLILIVNISETKKELL